MSPIGLHSGSSRKRSQMSISQRFNMFLLGVMLSGVVLSSAFSRPWKATPIQIAGDYALIAHTKSSTDFVNIRWWAEPTVMPGTPLAGILQKYIVISVVHFHFDPGGTISTDDIDTLEVRDGRDMPLTPVPRSALPPVAIGTLSTFEATFRQSIGRIGDGTKILYL